MSLGDWPPLHSVNFGKGISPTDQEAHVPASIHSLPICRTSPSVARITAEPALTRATPIFSISVSEGQVGEIRMLSGAAIALTNLAMVSRLLTPGAKTQSAPA